MQRDTSSHSLLDNRHNPTIQKYKMKTILGIFSAAACCLVTLALTTATPMSNSAGVTPQTENSPTPITNTTDAIQTPDASSVLSVPKPAVGKLNGYKLVITNVVKTLEFEVELEEDDNSTETSAESSTPIIETEIDVLNPELLEEVVAKITSTQTPKSIDGTKAVDSEDYDD